MIYVVVRKWNWTLSHDTLIFTGRGFEAHRQITAYDAQLVSN